MIAEHYNPELANTIYQEVYFTISGDQFPDDANLTHEVEGRVHEQHEATGQAQALANRFQQSVTVDVYGTWGYYGREFIESFTVKPECPIKGIRDDLAALGI
jgi:hypothetical protein